MVDWGNVPGWIAAVGSVGTLSIASIAARVAYNQLIHARTLREDQARPFVVVDFEPTRAGDARYMDLVIRNVGTTLARDVRIQFEPPIRSTLDPGNLKSGGLVGALAEAKLLRDGISSLPPGREYRLLFDDMAARYEQQEMERAYEVTVTLRSDRRVEEPLTQILDLDVYYGYMIVHEYGLHHIAKTLRAWAKKSGASNF